MPKATHVGRTVKIELRVTPQLKEAIRAAANAEGLSIAHWLERLAEKAIAREHVKTGRTKR